MTDWDAFCYIAARLLKRYSDKDVKRALSYLDAGILDSRSAQETLLMGLGTTHFQWGRDKALAPLFRQLLHRNPDLFLYASATQIEAFNALVMQLFSPNVAREFVQTSKVQKMAPKEEKAEIVSEKPHESFEQLFADFTKSLSSTPDFLREPHITAFLHELEEKKYDEAQVREVLAKQKEYLLSLQQFLRHESDTIKIKTGPLVQKLYGTDLSIYTDLPQEANRLLLESFTGKSINSPELTDDIVAEYKKQITDFYEGISHDLEDLVEKATARGRKIDEMSIFTRAFTSLTTPLKAFKDLHEEYSALEESVRKLQLSKQDLSKGTFRENETKLKVAYSHYLDLKASMRMTMDKLIQEAHESEERSQDDKSAIKRRLFEIFWNISPYQDLQESFLDMRAFLTDQLLDGIKKFYAGEATSRELLEICQEMPYEHDVVKLRNEITHRSSRLKDLRDEAIRLYRDVLETKRFLEIAGLEQERVHSDFIAYQATIRTILEDVENPFKAFSQAVTKDDINYVFRGFWIRIEDIQPKIEHGEDVAKGLFQKHAPVLKKAFLQALDTVEEVISLKLGKRISLVVPAERDLQAASDVELYNTIMRHIHNVEKAYSFTQPFSYFMQIGDHKTRLSRLQDAMMLDSHIDDMVHFAKAMQYAKTFEEERVDSILEAFERQHLVEEVAWSEYVERMHRAARLVEDEIFLDIGLLDRHALMDVDPKELNETLCLACKRAREHIFEPAYGLFASLDQLPPAGDSNPLCAKTLSDLKKNLNNWSEVEVDPFQSTDWLLEHLRSYCHHLFDTKVLLASHAGMLLPKCLEFVNELRSLVSYIEEILQHKRVQHKAEWGTPWIPECHSMRATIEAFEPEDETEKALEPLFNTIQEACNEIPEHSDIPLDVPFQELTRHLEEIRALSADPKKEHPFIYIPGYLAFFEMRQKNER